MNYSILLLYCPATYSILFFFFFNDPAPTEIYTLSLHDALPIWSRWKDNSGRAGTGRAWRFYRRRKGRRNRCVAGRSEEHTSELQSQSNLVCRLLLEKKKKTKYKNSACLMQTDREYCASCR